MQNYVTAQRLSSTSVPWKPKNLLHRSRKSIVKLYVTERPDFWFETPWRVTTHTLKNLCLLLIVCKPKSTNRFNNFKRFKILNYNSFSKFTIYNKQNDYLWNCSKPVSFFLGSLIWAHWQLRQNEASKVKKERTSNVASWCWPSLIRGECQKILQLFLLSFVLGIYFLLLQNLCWYN